MNRIVEVILANGLFVVGTLILLWSIKRWIERRDWK